MPRIIKTIIPRIKKSIRARGVLVSLSRSVLLPVHLFREYRAARRLVRDHCQSEFDRAYDVDTDGDFGGWTYLSDLSIPSPNWIHGNNYTGIDPERFSGILAGVTIKFEDFVFIDFGSGKGRALLLASEFPFKRIVGVEFSPELHAAAVDNIRKYKTPLQHCNAVESVCMDFVDFHLPPEPSVLFFFDPCAEMVFEILLNNIERSFHEHPREIYIVYVAPSPNLHLLDSAGFLLRLARNHKYDFSLYKTKNS